MGPSPLGDAILASVLILTHTLASYLALVLEGLRCGAANGNRGWERTYHTTLNTNIEAVASDHLLSRPCRTANNTCILPRFTMLLSSIQY